MKGVRTTFFPEMFDVVVKKLNVSSNLQLVCFQKSNSTVQEN